MPLTSTSVAQLEELINFMIGNDVRLVSVTKAQYDSLDTVLAEQGLSVSEWEAQWGVRLVKEPCH